MPRGIYLRTPAMREAIRQARLGTKASPEACAKMSRIARARALKPSWRKKVSEGTCRAMRSLGTRRKHLAGLRRAILKHGPNFKGGNGDRPVKFVLILESLLAPYGWLREFAIGIHDHKKLKTPTNYKVDFAHVEGKVAIECDGPAHRSFAQKEVDQKKNLVLKNLGWRVIRVPHD